MDRSIRQQRFKRYNRIVSLNIYRTLHLKNKADYTFLSSACETISKIDSILEQKKFLNIKNF